MWQIIAGYLVVHTRWSHLKITQAPVCIWQDQKQATEKAAWSTNIPTETISYCTCTGWWKVCIITVVCHCVCRLNFVRSNCIHVWVGYYYYLIEQSTYLFAYVTIYAWEDLGTRIEIYFFSCTCVLPFHTDKAAIDTGLLSQMADSWLYKTSS